MKIQIGCDCISAIRESGYALISGNEYDIPAPLIESLQSFAGSWKSLPADEYITGSFCYRFRRYGRLAYQPRSGRIECLPTSPFRQGGLVNRLYADMARSFAGVSEGDLENRFLHELVRHDFEQFGVTDDMTHFNWAVGVHQIKIVGKRDQPGNPTPEGIHQDGSRFLGIHLMARENVQGGVSKIYDLKGVEMASVLLVKSLDSILIEDARVMHSVMPIAPVDVAKPAVRDTLILTYDPDEYGSSGLA